MQLPRSLRLIYHLLDAVSLELTLRQRPIDGLPDGEAEQCGADRREDRYPPSRGIALRRIDERDLALLTIDCGHHDVRVRAARWRLANSHRASETGALT